MVICWVIVNVCFLFFWWCCMFFLFIIHVWILTYEYIVYIVYKWHDLQIMWFFFWCCIFVCVVLYYFVYAWNYFNRQKIEINVISTYLYFKYHFVVLFIITTCYFFHKSLFTLLCHFKVAVNRLSCKLFIVNSLNVLYSRKLWQNILL